MALSHITLESYFDYTFSLIHIHKWSLTEVENLLPWERDIYLIKLAEHIKEENRRMREAKQQRG